jgi:transposase
MDGLLADKGYDADAIRADFARRNTTTVIPGRSIRRIKIEHGRASHNQRNLFERFLGRFEINQTITTRFDQLAESFLSMVHITAARYWLKFVYAA